MAWTYIQYEYPVTYNFEKFLIWISADFDCYFSLKERSSDNWTYYAGTAGHALDTGSKLISYGNNESNAQANYLTTVKDSGGKVTAILPTLFLAKFVRLYVDDSGTAQIYEFRPSTQILADEIIAGTLEITDQFSAPPAIRMIINGQERIFAGNLGSGVYGFRGKDSSGNVIFELGSDEDVPYVSNYADFRSIELELMKMNFQQISWAQFAIWDSFDDESKRELSPVSFSPELNTTPNCTSDPNGNEANSLATWTSNYNTCEVSTLNPSAGSYCVHVVNLATGSYAVGATAESFTIGKLYRITLDVKVVSGIPRLRAEHGPIWGDVLESNLSPDNVWHSKVYYTTVPTGATIFRVGFSYPGNFEAYLDNISIKEYFYDARVYRGRIDNGDDNTADKEFTFFSKAYTEITVVETGTSTDNGSGYLEDTSKNWFTNEVKNLYLVDSSMSQFQINSNDSDTLYVTGTPSAGSYKLKDVNPLYVAAFCSFLDSTNGGYGYVKMEVSFDNALNFQTVLDTENNINLLQGNLNIIDSGDNYVVKLTIKNDGSGNGAMIFKFLVCTDPSPWRW